jgi:uncharacterized protein YutE (UPF0331/DUF86 family)
MPDLEVINKHLEALRKDLANLEKHRKVTEDDLKNNLDLLWILERGLFLVIQNIFDMFSHIASADFNETWDYYSDIPDILEKNDVLTEDQKNLLIKMSGFRNRLSHEYLGLDKEILLDIVDNKINDFYTFQKIIVNYCKL